VFFQKQMTRAITVHPMFLGPALRQHVRDQLVAEVEGTPVDNAGFIITGLLRTTAERASARLALGTREAEELAALRSALSLHLPTLRCSSQN
jgi:hypothetical protein